MQWVQSPVLMAWSHVGSRATWQRQCWIELCWPQLTPPSCPCCWSFPDRNCIASQAVQLQTLLHSCPTPPEQKGEKAEEVGAAMLCEQAAGEMLCQELGVEPLLSITTCMTTSASHPHLGPAWPWQGQRAESARPSPSMVMMGGHAAPQKHWR